MSETEPKIAAPNPGELQSTNQMEIHFIKSSQFRVVHADGAWFGCDPQGALHLTFYNDRSPSPRKVVVNVNQQGLAVDEDISKRESRSGLVREVEVDVVLSFGAALALRAGLDANIKNAQKAMEQSVPESVKQAIREAAKL